MTTYIAYVGPDRNARLLTQTQHSQRLIHTLVRSVDANALDLRENLQQLFNELAAALMTGHREVAIFNYEVGLPLILLSASMKQIKDRYTDLTIHYSTQLPQCCWEADQILFEGADILPTIQGQRLKYGSVLDAFAISLLTD